MAMKTRRYSDIRHLPSFEGRFDYLSLGGQVGTATFGHSRWVNQYFYNSPEWKHARDIVIIRDNSCDLGIPGYEIYTDLFVHHMNPITVEDIEEGADWILDPEFLITTSHRTHNAIHFGDATLLPRPLVARQPGDTRLW